MFELHNFLTSAVFALVIALVFAAPNYVGVGGMKAVRISLIVAWLIAVVDLCASMVDAPWRHLAIAVLVFGVPLAFLLFLYERWIVRQIKEKAEHADFSKSEIRAVSEDYRSNRDGILSRADYRMTICVYLINRGVETNIQSFNLELTVKGETYHGEQGQATDHVLERRDYFRRGEYQSFRKELVDLESRKGEPFLHNVGVEGWLHFDVRNVRWQGAGNDLPKSMRLTILDGLGDPPHEVKTDLPKWDLSPWVLKWRSQPIKPPSPNPEP